VAERNTPRGPYVIQANQHASEVFRQILQTLVGAPGIVNPTDLAVSPNGTPNMSVNVAAGFAVIAGTQSVDQGYYHVYNDATKNLTIAASDPTNPRRDLVVASVQDAAYTGASNQWVIQVITGTPAASPVDPAVPVNTMTLARILVTANKTSIVAGDLTDLRPLAPGRDVTGTIKLDAGTVAPAGWLKCDGSAVSRTTYAQLFARVGTAYGAGDGSTTFNLPNLLGRFPLGAGQGTGLTNRLQGATGGEEAHVLATAELPAHNHGITDPGHSHGAPSGTGFMVQLNSSSEGNTTSPSGMRTTNGGANTGGAGTGISTQNTGSGTAHNTMPPFAVVTYIIKT
jgi:microcystin-dependent protein